MKHWLQKRIKDQSGGYLVEVIVGSVILLFLSMMFTSTVSITTKINARSEALMREWSEVFNMVKMEAFATALAPTVKNTPVADNYMVKVVEIVSTVPDPSDPSGEIIKFEEAEDRDIAKEIQVNPLVYRDFEFEEYIFNQEIFTNETYEFKIYEIKR